MSYTAHMTTVYTPSGVFMVFIRNYPMSIPITLQPNFSKLLTETCVVYVYSQVCLHSGTKSKCAKFSTSGIDGQLVVWDVKVRR